MIRTIQETKINHPGDQDATVSLMMIDQVDGTPGYYVTVATKDLGPFQEASFRDYGEAEARFHSRVGDESTKFEGLQTFNTRRCYTREGQRIGWIKQGDRTFFADVDRGIHGLTNRLCNSDREVLRAYDNGDYEHHTDRFRNGFLDRQRFESIVKAIAPIRKGDDK